MVLRKLCENSNRMIFGASLPQDSYDCAICALYRGRFLIRRAQRNDVKGGGLLVDYNLEYGLRFVHRVGKRWAVQEVDANGRQIGGDHFDWAWPLDFTVTSCALSDYIEIKTELQTEETTSSVPPKTTQQQAILAQLRWRASPIRGLARTSRSYIKKPPESSPAIAPISFTVSTGSNDIGRHSHRHRIDSPLADSAASTVIEGFLPGVSSSRTNARVAQSQHHRGLTLYTW